MALLAHIAPAVAQAISDAELNAIARVEAEMPLVHDFMDRTGRYDRMLELSEGWRMSVAVWFDGYPSEAWQAEITERLSADRLILAYAEAIDAAMLLPELTDLVEAFLTSDLGQRLSVEEISIGETRMADPEQYAAALAEFQSIESADDPRRAIIQRAEEAGRHLAGFLAREEGMEFAFLDGLRAADYFGEDMSDGQLRDLMEFDADALTDNVIEYYNVFGMMMQDAFTLEELATYHDYVASDAGQMMTLAFRQGALGILQYQRHSIGQVIAPLWLADLAAEEQAAARDVETSPGTDRQ